ncbi:MAG: hypothetical protein A2913_02375 [Parcubacteria group bacterium RIFCSPLOWO2_01_FULL_40_65]|nr:MAG: hypothetical protein A2734_00145 [Parcubacteria group bacterium RIFCSPHIGHO2_01_FULL_40_30]OHB18960.1 MAG: hypothetical protein A3D40_00510 [Parcubacteria group bacterium RIFCSPHIGHO2_02_FULL_40_12]OHB20944.1 MAG: hypothetical protein A2913_02375 [Parcubacteria group bacterium RIFCSPLOWO2_01_FULL_40_65]OHB23104.1 MAG: hypothetical protein A3I22_00165 [Parcubacteria group bacterium RIFCSPLOWO2_02_FULL_40_12]OHB23824.1 MAG: hypothetical protein A3F96_02235 [Parcubacteria group bacterium R
MKRILKQIFIAAIFFTIISSISYLFYIKDSIEPTPAPLVSIPSLEIISQNILKVADLDYDFLVKIKNPNLDFGAGNASYEVSIFSRDNNLINILSGSISLLPGQTRYEIISSIKYNQEISDIVFKITDVNWQKLKEYIPQSLFLVKNQELALDQSPRLRATLSNNSNFDFDRADVYAVLFGENDKVLAVNKTDIRTFLSGTDRFFEVRWLKPFEGEVRRVEINAYTDMFKNENFIKQHGIQENFQRFY